jgi:ferredoxin
MDVEVDYRRCEGHAVCVAVAPEVFDIGDDDEQVRLVADTFDPSLHDVATLAAKRCPTQAIRITA